VAEPLIPADVRALYEQLLDGDSQAFPSDDPTWQEPAVQALLRSGLAVSGPREPASLTPTMPDTAFARVQLQWRRIVDDLRNSINDLQEAATRTQKLDLRSRRRRNLDYSCILVGNRRHTTAIHSVLYRSAETQVFELMTGPIGEAITLSSGEAQTVRNLYIPPEQSILADGGHYCVIIDDEFLSNHPISTLSGFLDGEETRVVQEKLPTKLLIVDGHTALVGLGPYGHPCLLIRDQGIVNALVAYFELKWAQAKPWSPPGVPLREKENGQRRRILDALAAGLKDESIARQQGISVRTVRRHISALMQELGVTTRFAAGVAAVRRGWLTPAS
jgi:DNA-binding CsgD family transcriptional regulator